MDLLPREREKVPLSEAEGRMRAFVSAMLSQFGQHRQQATI